jgi:hypothetical protein
MGERIDTPVRREMTICAKALIRCDAAMTTSIGRSFTLRAPAISAKEQRNAPPAAKPTNAAKSKLLFVAACVCVCGQGVHSLAVTYSEWMRISVGGAL